MNGCGGSVHSSWWQPFAGRSVLVPVMLGRRRLIQFHNNRHQLRHQYRVPSSARPDRPQSRKKGGKKTQGGFFRSMAAAAPVWAAPLAAGSDARRVMANRHGVWQLHVSRGAGCALIGRRSLPPGNRRTVHQPGRERPPSPAPRLFPAATQGVAHVPAASLRCALDSVRRGRRTGPGIPFGTRRLLSRDSRGFVRNERRVILTERSRPCL